MEVRMQIIVPNNEWSMETTLYQESILGKILVVLYFLSLSSSDPGKIPRKSYFYFIGSEKGIENWFSLKKKKVTLMNGYKQESSSSLISALGLSLLHQPSYLPKMISLWVWHICAMNALGVVWIRFLFLQQQPIYLSWLLLEKKNLHSWSTHNSTVLKADGSQVCCETWGIQIKRHFCHSYRVLWGIVYLYMLCGVCPKWRRLFLLCWVGPHP